MCQFRTLSVTQCCKLHHHVTRSSITHNRYMYAMYVMNYLCNKLEDKSLRLMDSKTKLSLTLIFFTFLTSDLLQTIIAFGNCICRWPGSWAHVPTHSVSTVSISSVYTCFPTQVNQNFNPWLNQNGMDNPKCELRSLSGQTIMSKMYATYDWCVYIQRVK